MAELATLARPYAEAFFAATQGQNQADLEWLDAVATVAADAQVQALADNPRVTDEQVFELVQTAAKVVASEKANNFLRLVIENGRLSVLPTIAAQVRTLVNAAQGVNEAIVQSAFELSDEALSDLAGTLEKRFGRSLKLTVELAPELIGGVRVVVGDEVFDTSVKARLEQMKSALLA